MQSQFMFWWRSPFNELNNWALLLMTGKRLTIFRSVIYVQFFLKQSSILLLKLHFWILLYKVNNKTIMGNSKILKQQQSLLLLKEKDKIRKCEICYKEFKDNNRLMQHFNIVHNFVKQHQCNICSSVFKIHSQLT